MFVVRIFHLLEVASHQCDYFGFSEQLHNEFVSDALVDLGAMRFVLALLDNNLDGRTVLPAGHRRVGHEVPLSGALTRLDQPLAVERNLPQIVLLLHRDQPHGILVDVSHSALLPAIIALKHFH